MVEVYGGVGEEVAERAEARGGGWAVNARTKEGLDGRSLDGAGPEPWRRGIGREVCAAQGDWPRD